MQAEILYASSLATSPESLNNISLAPIATMNLGTIPLVGAFDAYTGTQVLAVPVTIAAGDYLAVRFAVNSLLIASVNGFHAQASIALS